MQGLYSDVPTWLHRCQAGWKLAVLALATTGLFVWNDSRVLLLGALVGALVFVSLGSANRGARRLLLPMGVASLLVAAFHAALGQMGVGIHSGLRLMAVALLAFSVTLTTRFSDMLDVLETVLSPLKRFGVRVDELALQLALMMRFTEHFFALSRRMSDAYRVRTGRSAGWRILPPLVIQALLSARRVGDALEIRWGRPLPHRHTDAQRQETP